MSFFIGQRPAELIKLAEDVLGIKLTGCYLDFLQTFGAGSFGAQEIYGVINDDFESSSVPNAIWYTLTERKEVGLPHNLLIINDTGSDELYCLDFTQQDVNFEPPVVSFIPGLEINKQKFEVVANNFGDFLLDLVTQEL